jgi:hypothetical protein
MSRRMPVLRRGNKAPGRRKSGGQGVKRDNDFIAVLNSQRPTGTEIILHINQKQQCPFPINLHSFTSLPDY